MKVFEILTRFIQNFGDTLFYLKLEINPISFYYSASLKVGATPFKPNAPAFNPNATSFNPNASQPFVPTT
jgi:hypothetical protein